MTKESLAALLSYAGIHAPEETEEEIAAFPGGGHTLVSREGLQEALTLGEITGAQADRLWAALAEIEADEKLLLLSQALAWAYVRLLHFGRAWDFRLPAPRCLAGFAREAYPFLFLLSCAEAGRAFLRARGVPDAAGAGIPEGMIRAQLRKYRERDEIVPADYHWEINFYCRAIFRMGRFYFIPCRYDGPTVWRSREKTAALWPAGQRVRRDGQLDGVNGMTDPAAVETVWLEDENSITACPVNPRGTVYQTPVTLDKGVWHKALLPGDPLLALHIPGGEGYTPEAVRDSAREAFDFYARYDPELPIRGVWSESWLYDPGLEALLPPESRIIRVQRQFYRYPTMEGDAMARKEVFGDGAADLARFRPHTRLQQAMRDAMLRGVRFHTTGMVFLREDLEKIGCESYCFPDFA